MQGHNAVAGHTGIGGCAAAPVGPGAKAVLAIGAFPGACGHEFTPVMGPGQGIEAAVANARRTWHISLLQGVGQQHGDR